jgi:hypothetical protein
MLATSSLFDPKHVLDLDHDGVPDTRPTSNGACACAESLVLDLDHDGRVTVAEYRQALKLPDAKQVQASLLSAGPGRQDLTNEFGLDMTAPGLHSRRYQDVGLMRTGPEGVFNPKSTPSSLVVRSLSVINWAATYATRGVDWLGRYAERTGQRRGQALAELGIEFPPGLEGDADLINRAMVLDGRTIGAIGLQADSFPGIMYARVLRQGAPAPPELVRGLRLGFEATQIRKLLYDTDLASIARPALDPGALARGRAIFFDRVVGDIVNQQILVDVPPVYAERQPPAAAPRAHRRDPAAGRAHSRALRVLPFRHHARHRQAHSQSRAGNPTLHRLPSRARTHGPAGHGWPAQGQRPCRTGLDLRRVRHRPTNASADKVQRTCSQLPRQPPRPGHAHPLHQLQHPALRRRRRRPRARRRARRPGAGGIGTDALFGFEVDRATWRTRTCACPSRAFPRPIARPRPKPFRSPARGCARRR